MSQTSSQEAHLFALYCRLEPRCRSCQRVPNCHSLGVNWHGRSSHQATLKKNLDMHKYRPKWKNNLQKEGFHWYMYSWSPKVFSYPFHQSPFLRIQFLQSSALRNSTLICPLQVWFDWFEAFTMRMKWQYWNRFSWIHTLCSNRLARISFSLVKQHEIDWVRRLSSEDAYLWF